MSKRVWISSFLFSYLRENTKLFILLFFYMKISLATLIIFICAGFYTVQGQATLQQKAIVLKRMIELNHVSPRPVNDEFSKDLFQSFIVGLDEEKIYFTEADITSLSKYKNTLDEELQGKEWKFFTMAAMLYRNRLHYVDSLIAQITQKPFDFLQKDQLPSGFDTVVVANNAELKTKWTRLLKYEVLNALSSAASLQVSKTGAVNRKEIFLKEPEFRNKVATRHRQKIKNVMADGLEEICGEKFLSSLAACFDPHTDYFDLSDKKKFQTGLNPQGYYFGFGLKDNEKNEITINNLMPGSPAWKCGQLNKDDVLIQLQWEGQSPVELYTLSAEDVDGMIRDSKENSITLTVRKANGSVISVPLHKEKVENEGQYVKSFILSGKNKIGYIYLPGFYTNWEDADGSSCAEDMAKEIIKLKKDGIEGIILDVRFNGGGSLQEAVELSGIFIDDGPLCLLKSKDGKTLTLKDVNRGTIWDGPLLLLVNGQSASASEMVAGVLQDYNRAVIVGSTTYGKGTAQQIIPVDTAHRVAYAQSSEYGFVKLTDGRIYRVTGKSVQAQGVVPDIVLPDGYNKKEWHEAYMPFYLKPDTIKGNSYFKPLPKSSYASIKKLSDTRIASSEKFQELQAWQKESIENDYSEAVSLKWDDWEKEILEEYKSRKEVKENIEEKTSAYEVQNHSADKASANKSNSFEEWNKRWFKRLSGDLYVEESFFILSDLIQASKNKSPVL